MFLHVSYSTASCCFHSNCLFRYLTKLFLSRQPHKDYDSFCHLPSYRTKCHAYIGQEYEQLLSISDQDNADTVVPLSFFTRKVGAELKLRIYRDPSNETSMSSILKEITDSNNGSNICNAEAYYRLGLIALGEARDSGELRSLWDDQNDTSQEFTDQYDSTFEARKLFHWALANAPPASFLLTKNILRSLALMTGPKQGQPKPGLAAASLIHMSVGGSSRNIVGDSSDSGKVKALFKAFDDESLDFEARVQSVGQLLLDSVDLIPSNWNISAMATCPTGELLVSSLRVSVSSCGDKVLNIATSCIFPASSSSTQIEDSEVGIHADVLTPLDRIIERSQKQLHGITEEVQNEQYTEESSKRKWWKKRHSIDDDLQSLLRYAERRYFMEARQRLVPDDLFSSERQSAGQIVVDDDDDSSECSDLGPGNLVSKFDEAEYELPASACLNFDKDAERSNLTKLTVAVIKTKLASYGIHEKDVKKMRKTELIDLLLSQMEDSHNNEALLEESNAIDGDEASSEAAGPCTILVLDEHLLRFPFESMDVSREPFFVVACSLGDINLHSSLPLQMLSNIAVTRVPSLPFVLATLLETESIHSTAIPIHDPKKVRFVLDPEANLAESASTLGSALNSLASQNGWEWEGVVGQMPSSEFMAKALTEENGLYLYCGHGGGEKAYSRSQVEELMTERDDGVRGCRPSVVLMGCSSGKLQSVNFPKENPTGHVPIMHYEPEGIALSYLNAGSPCVVGNLWDVTDRDIDR